ncbi:ankyrin, partial [Hyaloscypha variabilis F]
MDHDTPLQEAQNAQASSSSQDPSKTVPNSRSDKWNEHKDEILKLYIQQNNTLETTMQLIEGQGGPKASVRTWKSKLKEWNYEKYLTSNDMNIISAKAKKRKNEDGKETVFYHWDSEISFERIERFRKAPKTSGMASPGAETPPNVTYHTPRPEHQITSIETPGNHLSKSLLTPDLLPSTELEALPADHPILETDEVALYELDRTVIAGDEIGEIFTADLQVTNIGVNQQQFLHFMPDGVPRLSPHPSLRPFSDRSSPQNFNESWMIQDFDELFMNSGINLNQDSRDPSPIRRLDTFLSESFSAGGSQASFSVSTRSFSSWALTDIPWFRFQELIKTTGSFGYNPRMNQVFHSSTLNSDMHLTFLDLAHGNVELNEKCRLLSTLFRSPPGSINQKILPEFSSKLQELIPESFDGEIRSKLQQLFHPSNNSPLHELTEFASYFLSNNTLNEKRTDEFLEWAIEKRPKELFKSLFAIETPTVDAFSERILESVARSGNASILQLFIECGLDVRYLTGISGGRYLQLSLYNGSVDVAHLLLDNGADVNPPLGENPHNSPPLLLATMKDYDEITSRLLEADAEVNTMVNGCTALSYAILGGSVDLVGQLLQAGADVDIGEIGVCGNLDWAYLHKRSIYHIILPMSRKAKTSLTISGILSAANRGKQVLSEYLDRHKAQNTKRILEMSLCTAIAEKQSTATISVLLEFGVDPNTETVNTYEPPLHLAVMNYNIDLAECLLNAGARIDAPGILEAAAWSEDGFDTMNFLIEQGADVLASGGNALREAIWGNNLGGIKLLMDSGVKINDASLCEDGYTYLAKAASWAEIKTAKYLVDNGAIINAPPSIIAGVTPLQAGAEAGNIEMVKFLLDIGSDVNAEPSSSKGTTALEAS